VQIKKRNLPPIIYI